jgi:hypothetical protein
MTNAFGRRPYSRKSPCPVNMAFGQNCHVSWLPGAVPQATVMDGLRPKRLPTSMYSTSKPTLYATSKPTLRVRKIATAATPALKTWELRFVFPRHRLPRSGGRGNVKRIGSRIVSLDPSVHERPRECPRVRCQQAQTPYRIFEPRS